MTDVEQAPPQNGIDTLAGDDKDNNAERPADIQQDMREMERRKRVEAIMGSKLFREELERIVDSAREGGGTSGILQQLSDIVGIPVSRVGGAYKAHNCMLPINDIRGVEAMGYAKGEKILRCKLAATFRLLDIFGWSQGGLGAQITARLKVDQEYFLVNPYGLMYHEITASSLNKVDMQGLVVEQGTTNFGVNRNHFALHSAVHAARPDIRCVIYIGCSPVVAISSLRTGLLPLTKDACVLGEITTHPYSGALLDAEERDRLVRNLGPNSKVILLSNHGALCCGETIEEAFYAACHIVQACETQLKLLPVGLDNLVLIPEETRKTIYEQARRPPEDLEKHFAAALTIAEEEAGKEAAPTKEKVLGSTPKWRVGGAEFEGLMRMLDNAGYRTGYIYRHPLIKSEPPKPKSDVELPPAVSSLGYLLEEEELYRQGIWKKGDLRKGGDRSRWLNSPNVYQKVEVLETGTPDPKKITKWVADGSPTHSTPVRIEDALQFVPTGTSTKEFKRLQQQIKDNRRADKISAGPQSHILEGVTWDEANRLKEGNVSASGDHVVLMGAASKGIIQRGFQHNAAVYKAPYAKNPFDNVTDDELNEYKRTVERKKKSIHGEYTDTDFSESEPLSSLQTSGGQKQTTTTTTAAAVSHSEPEDAEHQVLRIQTQQAPVPSQAEVVMSDASLDFINGERSHTASNRKPPTGRVLKEQFVVTHVDLAKALNAVMRMRKYAFLYATPQIAATNLKHEVLVYVINKIETYASYTYPTVNKTTTTDTAVESEQDANVNTPYRTVSHYGFNYPLAYMPSVPLYPHNLNTISDEFVADVHMQRNLVIEFLKSATLKLRAPSKESFVSVKEIHFTSPSSGNDTETEEEPNYTTVKKLHLMPSNKRKRAWLRTTSTCSSNTQTATTSSAAYLEEGETSGMCSLSTHFDDGDYSAGSCASLACPPPPPPPPPPTPPPLPSKNFLKCEQKPEKQSIKKQEKAEARTSVKAEINATQHTLDLSIAVHINQNQWGAEAFQNLAQIIEAEMQILSQQFTQKANNVATTSAVTTTKAADNHMARNFQLLEQELEKLLNSILCVNALTQNLRTAYNQTE